MRVTVRMTRPWQNSFFISFTQGKVIAGARGVNPGTSTGFSPETGNRKHMFCLREQWSFPSELRQERSLWTPGSLTVRGDIFFTSLASTIYQHFLHKVHVVYESHWLAASLVARTENVVCYKLTATGSLVNG